MAKKVISKPILLIDNEQFEYVPNTLTAKLGSGDRSVLPQVAGNGVVTLAVGQDATTEKSMVGFDLYTTQANKDLLNTFRDKIGIIGIQIVGPDGTDVFEEMTLITDPEINYGNDGSISLEFEGARAA